MVETLFSENGSVIYASPEWNRLLETIDKGAVISKISRTIVLDLLQCCSHSVKMVLFNIV